MATDRRELIEKAWNDAEKSDELDQEAAGGDTLDDKASLESTEEKPEGAEDEADAGKSEELEGSKEEKHDPAYKAEKEAASRRAPGEEKSPSITDKAPQSWKPEVREDWAKTPERVRAEITRRELQIQQTLSQTDNVRKFANEFAQVVNPYANIIRQHHTTPLQAVQSLMHTAAGLISGDQEQKCEIMAELLGNYGVDLGILDKVLSKYSKDGKSVPAKKSFVQEQVPEWARPLLATQERLTVAQQQHEQRMTAEAEKVVGKLESKPFFEDLREDMADILEVADRRGIDMTPDQAYTRALALRPELAKIVAQREAAKKANGGNGDISRQRRAASTVSGAPVGKQVGERTAPTTRREAIEAAWDEAAGNS